MYILPIYIHYIHINHIYTSIAVCIYTHVTIYIYIHTHVTMYRCINACVCVCHLIVGVLVVQEYISIRLC